MDRTTRDAAKATRQNEFVGYLKAAVARGVDNLPGARLLPVDRIDPNPYQPRTQPLDPGAAREMDASIRAHGVLQPIVVRPAGDRYQIVDGEQRWRAAQRAGLTTVPGVERQVSDEDMELLALLANTQRTDLAPLDEANAYRRIMTQRALSLRAMADLVHKSHEHVAQRLRLLDNPDITAAVADGWLTPTVALSVDRVKDAERRAALLDRHRPEGSPTLADARAARQADEMEQSQHAPPVKYLTPTQGNSPTTPLHEAAGTAGAPHVPTVKYLTPRQDTRDAQQEERDTTLDAPIDVNLAPSAQPRADEDWVRVHDLQTVILSRTTTGRATREQVLAALWADLETVDK
ncbi:MAG: ParB/RepB/Spo0J family partition protein [Chloroflexota bacterium]|nr:ParB/RepB/Spo0J family partition protein [Chloroflexota bacterium]